MLRVPEILFIVKIEMLLVIVHLSQAILDLLNVINDVGFVFDVSLSAAPTSFSLGVA